MAGRNRYQETRRALGSEVVLTLVLTDNGQIGEAFGWLWREINLFEATFSRFRPDSELTRVNQRAGTPTAVSPEFVELLTAARRMSDETSGLYNPFILPRLQAAGYKGSWPAPEQADPAVDYSERRSAQISELVIDRDAVELPPDSALDFGGIGKGYLLDSLAQQLLAQGVRDFWLSLGGDIICAGRDADGSPWRVGVQSPLDDTIVAAVQNDTGEPLAIATSGITKRRGEGWHHLIDPRTGRPADTGVLSATVVTAQGVRADVYAKCAVIAGQRQAAQLLRRAGINDYILQVRGADNSLQLV